VTLIELLLWPLKLPYGAVTYLRSRAYRNGILRQRRLDGMVISVGNLTTGGTGKTPMVLWIAQRLLSEGRSTGILTRGYRGEGEGASSTSDEVQLLRARLGERVPLGVGADRFGRGSELAKRGIEAFVLDDGFQHLQLARDVDIVLIDATNPFGGGHLLPAGRLREPLSALSRADVIVITRSDQAPAVEAAIRRNSDAPIFYARAHLEYIQEFRGESSGTKYAEACPRKWFAFSGIGNPAAFRADLREWGLDIAGYKTFPDHHRYTAQEVKAIEGAAYAAGANAIICTEKDSFNLSGVPLPAMDLYRSCISLQIAREQEFWQIVMTVAESRIRSRQ
jgi:tetraacyldisaccharide 4'-kinase